jgi:hypothetical protein
MPEPKTLGEIALDETLMTDHDKAFEKLRREIEAKYESDPEFKEMFDRAVKNLAAWERRDKSKPLPEPTPEELMEWDRAGEEWDRAADEAVERERAKGR